MPAAFDRSKSHLNSSLGGATDQRVAGATGPEPKTAAVASTSEQAESEAEAEPEPDLGPESESGGRRSASAFKSAPDHAADDALRTVVGSGYGRNLTRLAGSVVDPRRIEVERALFETLFDQVPVGIAIYDTERRYVLVNQTLAGYNGVPAGDHVGLRPEELNEDLHLTVPLLQQQVLESGEPVVDTLVRAATRATEPGTWQYWSVSYSRLQTEDGRVVGLSAVVMDVTERHKAAERSRLARERAALLNAANSRIGTTLDIDRIAAALADVAVPYFCDRATVYLLDAVPQPGSMARSKAVATIALSALTAAGAAGEVLRMHAVAARGRTATPAAGAEAEARRSQTRRSRLRGSSGSLPFAPGTALYECLAAGRARFLDLEDSREGALYAPDSDAVSCGGDAEDLHCAERSIVVPLNARGALLGAVRFERAKHRDDFTLIDLEIADELAARTAVSMDNARLYIRERDTALMLQRSLMPQRFDAVEGTQVAFRYRPGSAGAQIGGDWCDVIPLPGRRVAFVMGDVMGSGLSAAGIMSQFRTAARTLAQLDLNPAQVLRELDELARSMSESHLATCVYAVYDPVLGRCVMSSAGHPPPVLATSGGGVELIELSPGAPLGVGGQRFDERELTIEPGCVLALYTDGLVEGRDRDIETGIDELLGAVSKSAPAGSGPEFDAGGSAVADSRRLEAACDAAFEALLGPQRSDDATLLIAALGRFPESRIASWVLTSQPTVAARARELVRRCLHEWSAADAVAKADDRGLSPLAGDVADVVELLVSELVTNALRYGRGPIGLRLLRGASTVVCEVSDELEAAPRLRTVQHSEEGGRGLYLVDQLSLSWGTRTTAHGKIVWFEV